MSARKPHRAPTPAMTRLDGLIAAPFTPFDRKGDVSLPVIAQQVRHLLKTGVRGAYVCGTTGEGISCTVAERKAILEEWVRRSGGRLVIIAHVGALSVRDAQELAAHAQACGADAASIVPPNFFKPASVAGLVAHVAAVAAAAPRLPFYYYHTMMSGVDLSMPAFLEAAERSIPTLAGVKFNSFNLYEYQNCLRACGGRYDIVYGVDEVFAGALTLGARAFIGSTYNYAAPLYHAIREAVDAGRLEEARAGMARVCAIVDLLEQHGGLAAGKAMMGAHGIDVGDPRLPLGALAPARKAALVRRLREILA
ncbi:MAG TPA: dihydrodipicolinate synthase family protein [Vicinamibacterales bacterium]|nr:dihydrodipicolinate synthase family protein [Vicinamibacterales bacterium]HPW21857.1 dihydrodipicolinate synthase family protein [Vicinamibacterales bacterium]